MKIPNNVIYNGIQEGINFNLHIFTEMSTGGSFGIKTTIKNINLELSIRTKQLIESFKRSKNESNS